MKNQRHTKTSLVHTQTHRQQILDRHTSTYFVHTLYLSDTDKHTAIIFLIDNDTQPLPYLSDKDTSTYISFQDIPHCYHSDTNKHSLICETCTPGTFLSATQSKTLQYTDRYCKILQHTATNCTACVHASLHSETNKHSLICVVWRIQGIIQMCSAIHMCGATHTNDI